MRWTFRLRRLRRVLGYGLLVALILFASVVALLSQLLPLLERHPDRVAAWLGARAGQAVAFERLDARWTRRGPLLTLDRLAIGDGEERLEIGRAELLVSIYAGLLPGWPLTELRLDGLELELSRDRDGAWALEGLAQGRGGAKDPLAALQGLGELQIRDAALAVRVADPEFAYASPRMDARLRVDGARVRAGLLLYETPERPPLAVVVDLERDRGAGRLWLGGDDIEASALAGLTGLVGIEPLAGEGAFQIWAEWRAGALQRLRLESDLAGVVLRGRMPIAVEPDAEGRASTIEPRLGVDRWRASLRWRRLDDGGWRLEVPHLAWDVGRGLHSVDGLLAGAGARGGVAVDNVEIASWAALASLSDRLPEGLRRWLYLAAPHGRLVAVEVAGGPGEIRHGRARFEHLGWLPVDTLPGIDGLAGNLEFDGRAAVLRFEPDAQAGLNWPRTFGEPLPLALSGGLRAWREGEGYVVDSDGLRLVSEGLALRPALHLDARAAERPALYASAEIEPGPVTALKRFWLRHTMKPQLIDWLDTALTGGELLDGRVVFGGELDDWPFRNDEGRFLARLRMGGVPLRFSPDWPAAERLDAEALFTAKSMTLHGSGAIAGGEVERVQARIDDFRASVLELELEARSGGAELLNLLRASPLMEHHGEVLQALSLGGRARARLTLRQPFRPDLGEFELRGHADLAGAPLAHTGWGIAFDRAEGRIRFGRDGLAADELQVWLGEDVASFSLAVGSGFVADPGRLAEASLRGRFPVQVLLDHAAELDWLRPHLAGRSEWNLAVLMPRPAREGEDPVARLRIESDLRGVALDLPAPLRKPPEQAMPLTVTLGMPVTGAPLTVELGALMSLHGRIADDGGFDGTIGFGGAATAPDPEPGLRILGQVPVLDLAGWSAFALGDAGAGRPLRLDVQAGELDLLDRAFLDTRVRIEVAPERGILELDGPEIAGRLDFPRDGVAALEGEFERLYWPRGRYASAATGDPDPTAVPPLRLRVADLRFGSARLGRAVLDTYPTPEGLHVERLSTDSEMLRLEASGDWTRIEGSSRSRFALQFESDDIGRMLDALGFTGLIEGGQTRASMVASWAGSPAAFGLDRVDGELAITVGSGRFLDVEPGGAGRLLGLISLAEVPRRLLLDFGDLFGEGLRFSAIEGRFVLAAGVASTDDLRINSSSAQINVRGRTLLAEQRYDQTIEVLPKTSSMFPALGALTAGPAGVALGALAQAILKSPMQKMGRTVFRVTGPWSEPEVEVLERSRDREENGGSESPSAPR